MRELLLLRRERRLSLRDGLLNSVELVVAGAVRFIPQSLRLFRDAVR